MRSLFLALWWLCTLYSLFSGIFALISPGKWLTARWLPARPRGLQYRVGLVRLLGALVTASSLGFVLLGVLMTSTNRIP